MGEEDVRHAARPFHRIHFIAVELGASPETGGRSVIEDFSIVAMGKVRGCLLLLLIPTGSTHYRCRMYLKCMYLYERYVRCKKGGGVGREKKKKKKVGCK